MSRPSLSPYDAAEAGRRAAADASDSEKPASQLRAEHYEYAIRRLMLQNPSWSRADAVRHHETPARLEGTAYDYERANFYRRVRDADFQRGKK